MNKNVKLKIEGVKISKLKQNIDNKGAVYHYINSESPTYKSFGEIYFSKINSGVVKGWKLHKNTIQNMCVPYGELKIVIFDNRFSSKTFGEIDEIYLNDNDEYALLTIPTDLWYSFQSLSKDFTLLTNLIDKKYDSGESETMQIKNDLIPYLWE